MRGYRDRDKNQFSSAWENLRGTCDTAAQYEPGVVKLETNRLYNIY